MALLNTIKKDGFTWHMIKTAGAAIITGGVGFVLSTQLGLKDDVKIVSVGACVLLGALAATFIRTRVLTFSEDSGKRYMGERTGIIEVYKNLEACKEDLQADFKKARQISFLLQIGRREFGDSEASYFQPPAMEKREPETKIRILRASPDSPFLSEARAEATIRYRTEARYDSAKARYNRWQEDIRRLKKEIELLKSDHQIIIEDREHKEPYLWRIFLFDDIAYVSAYLDLHDTDKITAVYKFRKGENSLYTVFKRYFEYLWNKYDPNGNSDAMERWANLT
ncbi:MAG: hypothetical protein NT169_21500 [Chloroflexi bacterium]|nr:hypothetical protein [Chloroflexota bacterium]